jgi:hypothetical protein
MALPRFLPAISRPSGRKKRCAALPREHVATGLAAALSREARDRGLLRLEAKSESGEPLAAGTTRCANARLNNVLTTWETMLLEHVAVID